MHVFGCSTNADCSLNGVCQSAHCICKFGWTGESCGQLDLLPVDFENTNGGYKHPKTSTWGGSIIMKDGMYHMWLAEMLPFGTEGDAGAGSCGLTSWATNSQITHVTSTHLLGPYVRKEVVVPVWSHNPKVVMSSDGTLLLFHIGDGTFPAGKNLSFCAQNGTSPCGLASTEVCGLYRCDEASMKCVPGEGKYMSISECSAKCHSKASSLSEPSLKIPHSNCDIELHVAKSSSGPWQPYKNASIVPCLFAAANNPAPFIHPNGTVYVAFNDGGTSLWKAESWHGPYTHVADLFNTGEDPFIWVDAEGYWHCLFHGGDTTTGHAYSIDGHKWIISSTAANSTVSSTSHGDISHGKRERPHLYFDDHLNPTAFITGVCLTPECDPFSGHFDRSADCSPAAQNHRCGMDPGRGYYDRTYTLVQGVRNSTNFEVISFV